MKCPICLNSRPTVGVLCDGCRDKLKGHTKLVPEQVSAQTPKVVRAVLIDQWGRPNPIGATTVVGRDADKARAFLGFDAIRPRLVPQFY